MEDKVNHPNHYTRYRTEVISITRHLPFCQGNVVKYALRAPFKNGQEDLDKALVYLGWCEDEPVPIRKSHEFRVSVAAYRAELDADGSEIAEVQGKFLQEMEKALETGEYSGVTRLIEDLREAIDETESPKP